MPYGVEKKKYQHNDGGSTSVTSGGGTATYSKGLADKMRSNRERKKQDKRGGITSYLNKWGRKMRGEK